MHWRISSIMLLAADYAFRLKLVIDHLAYPGYLNTSLDAWTDGITTVAQMPNVYCKMLVEYQNSEHCLYLLETNIFYYKISLKCIFEQLKQYFDW